MFKPSSFCRHLSCSSFVAFCARFPQLFSILVHLFPSVFLFICNCTLLLVYPACFLSTIFANSFSSAPLSFSRRVSQLEPQSLQRLLTLNSSVEFSYALLYTILTALSVSSRPHFHLPLSPLHSSLLYVLAFLLKSHSFQEAYRNLRAKCPHTDDANAAAFSQFENPIIRSA